MVVRLGPAKHHLWPSKERDGCAPGPREGLFVPFKKPGWLCAWGPRGIVCVLQKNATVVRVGPAKDFLCHSKERDGCAPGPAKDRSRFSEKRHGRAPGGLVLTRVLVPQKSRRRGRFWGPKAASKFAVFGRRFEVRNLIISFGVPSFDPLAKKPKKTNMLGPPKRLF